MAMAKNPLITKNRFKNLFPCREREQDLNKRKKDFSNAPFSREIIQKKCSTCFACHAPLAQNGKSN